ncbi:rhodanese-like domain-containing protein [Desulfovibrio inopinatus]|uniref:rhodanese-like domain-containing protein n=1 Tax=Desulfovibrio inopinatus TaxID=102109 RepID=UPI00041ECFB9|nr:rhodanese-like domain-containing protein [Desulfovibrio inopinatus]
MKKQLRGRKLVIWWGVALVVCAGAAIAAGWLKPRLLDSAQKRLAVSEMYYEYKQKFPDVIDIRPEEAIQLLGEGNVIFVDDREPKERAVSTIPGAISADDLREHPEQYSGKTLIVYCTISYRSGKLAEEYGPKYGLVMKNMIGGILGWVHAGGPIVDPSGRPVLRVHVYGPTWDLAPDGYETVW